jgi:hypothetical protein
MPWDNMSALLNSAFTTSLVGALAGAFAGARGAQHVAERARESELLLSQIRTTNAALTTAFTISNVLLAYKKQHIKPLFEMFSAKKAELAEFQKNKSAGAIPRDQTFEFVADLRTLQMPLVPLDLLERLMFEKLSIVGRPLSLTAAIAGAVGALQDVTQRRAALIELFKNLPEANRSTTFPAMYFGLPYAQGRVSTEYADILSGLHSYADDAIFFSELLCKDLMEFGEAALAKYKARVKKTKERVSVISFDEARAAGLMPDPAAYEDWLRGFQRHDDA